MSFNARRRPAARRPILALAFATAAATTLGWVALSRAQTRPVAVQPMQAARPVGGLNPDSFYGKETFQGVSVRDSLEAIKKLEDARRMERFEDWNKAADWYQEVIEKYGQYVVPSGTDANNTIRQYTGIERPVQENLAKWPKAGLDAYRNRYGAVASTLLEQARQGDKEGLSRVMKLYFITDAGRDAGVRLIDLLLEDGDFAEAARVGDRLLDWHPNLIVERPKVLFRTALAYHLSGDPAKAKERLEQLKSKHPGAVGTLFGKDIALADALDRLLQVPPPVSVATASGSVRLNPGGDESRSLVSGAKARPGARLASIEYSAPPAVRGAGQQVPQDVEGVPIRGRDGGLNVGVMPVADDGEMFFQDGSRVYAVSLQSGVALPGWTQSYPNTNGQYTINNYGLARNQQFTLALTENAVLGVLGFSDRLMGYGVPANGSDRGTRLVCLDRATGKERWVARPSKIPEENLRALDFSGSPLVVGESVYVIGRGGKNLTAEDCYVLCYDLSTGAYKWGCFIASANNGQAFNGQPNMGDTLSHLAYSSGRVYVLTNLGACAALDAHSGTISWLNIYPRDPSSMDMNMQWGRMGMGIRGGVARGGGDDTKPWEFNPVIVRDGRVFILPTDAKHIMVYDAGTGAEVRRIETAAIRQQVTNNQIGTEGSTPEALLAVEGDQMILSGGNSVYCVDWTKPAPEDLIWHCGFATAVVGRAFVTSDSVFVCTETGKEQKQYASGGLVRIDRNGGRRRDTYPAKKDWDEGEGPGNVTVIGDQVVVAGAKRVNVYADMALARKRLDDDVAANPFGPEPRLRYAEVMFVAGQMPVAMEKLDETVKLLGGMASMRSGAERDHLFNDCIQFAVKLRRNKAGDTEKVQESVDAITRLYDLAAAAADADSQQVNYRVSRARFHQDFVQEDSLAAAIRLYQEILTSPKLRAVPLVDDEVGGATQAGQVAKRMIAAVKKQSPQAYEAFEKAAEDALAAAGTDPALLKNVADTYPNSVAAPKAMAAAATAFEEQSDYRHAAATLRQAYAEYGETADKPRLLEAMARNYLAMPDRTADRVDTAAARLASAVKLGAGATPIGKALSLPGQKVLAEPGVTINDALKAVQNYKAQAVASRLPVFRLADMEAYYKARAAYDEALEKATSADDDDGKDAAKPAPALPLPPPTPEPFIPANRRLVIADIDALVKPPLDLRERFARHDRILAWTGSDLAMYPVGAAQPLGRSGELTSAPRNVVWVEDGASALVWGDNEIALLSADDAHPKWKTLRLKALPKIEVVSGGATDENPSASPAGAAEAQQLELQQQQVFINRGFRRRGFIGQPQQVMVAANAAAAPVAAGPEAIASVRPIDDKVIVATTAGQLFAIRVADGTLAWHTRIAASAPITRLAATDDFTVARVDEGAGAQLVVVETLTGQLIKRFAFTTEAGNVPVNFTLAPDGMLVWITPDHLCAKDLFEPRKELSYDIPAGPGEAQQGRNVNVAFNGQVQNDAMNTLFGGATAADQLLISEGRVVVVTNGGRNVSLYSLETGKLIDFPNPEGGGRRIDRLSTLPPYNSTTPTQDWSAALHILGSKLYVCTRGNGPVCYNLDRGAVIWGGALQQATTPDVQFHEPYVGQDFFVLLDRPGARPGAKAPTNTVVRMSCYSRGTSTSGVESGKIIHTLSLRDDAGIAEFQGVDGGFYYLSGDKRLHFLQGAAAGAGAANPAPAK